MNTRPQATAERHHMEAVERLLATKAEINAAVAKDKGRMTLHAVAQDGRSEMVYILKRARAHPTASAKKSSREN